MTDAEEAPEAPKVTWDQVDSGSFPVRAASAPPPAPPRRGLVPPRPPILEHLGLAIVRGGVPDAGLPGQTVDRWAAVGKGPFPVSRPSPSLAPPSALRFLSVSARPAGMLQTRLLL